MIKVALALVSTAAGLVLLLSFKSHSAGPPRSALAGAGSPSRTGTDSGGRTGAGTTAPSQTRAVRRPTASAHPAGRSGTFAGDPIDTEYGTMQVAAVVSSGRLTDINLLSETDGGRSHQIDDAAIPVLRSEALSAHGANIDVVSGATVTSEGYAQSLQSALDKAGI